mmetsp:Transcript_33542/g.60136  ORF Transcript_33542/g.60136 Transcript_33542/m.60136 type:complete len:395 (-) Transcript_33542:147-1331(-)
MALLALLCWALLLSASSHNSTLGPCPFQNIDIVLEVYKNDMWLMQHALSTLERFMKCWHRMNLVVPYRDLALAEHYNICRNYTNCRVIPMYVPPVLEKHPGWSGYLSQSWNNMWADNYTEGAEFIMFFDTDVIFARPFTCDTLFDAQGRPYWYYFEFHKTKFRDECEELIGHCPHSFMSIFPIIVSPWIVQESRREIMRRWPGVDFDHSVARWMTMTRKHQPEMFSQFTILGNMAHRYPNLTHTLPCGQKEDPKKDAACLQSIPLAWHKWPYGMGTGSKGRIPTLLNDVFKRAGVKPYDVQSKGQAQGRHKVKLAEMIQSLVRSKPHYSALMQHIVAFGACVEECGGRAGCACPIPPTLVPYPNRVDKLPNTGIPATPCPGPCPGPMCGPARPG